MMKRRTALQVGVASAAAATVLGWRAPTRAEAAGIEEFGPAMLSVALAGFAADGNAAYLSTRNQIPAKQITHDHTTARMTVLSTSLGNLPYAMTTAPDGMVFIGMYNPDPAVGGVVWQYHPLSGALTSLGSVTPATGSPTPRRPGTTGWPSAPARCSRWPATRCTG